MYNDTTLTVVGNLTADPWMRRLEHGVVVANFRVASTSRKFDREAGKHVDGDVLFMQVSCWRDLAKNVVTSLQKGDPIVVTGRVFTRTYEKDGQTHTVNEMEAAAVGPDLSKGVARFQRIRSVLPERERTNAEVDGDVEASSDEPVESEQELAASVA
jgi:single-strand DNA-binding protein